MTRSDEVELAIWRSNAEHPTTQPRLTRAEVDEIVRYFVAVEENVQSFLAESEAVQRLGG